MIPRRMTPVRIAALLTGAVLGLIVSVPDLRSSQGEASPTLQNRASRRSRSLSYHAPPIATGPVDLNDGIIQSDKPVVPKANGPIVGPKPTPFSVNMSRLGEVVNPHDFHYIIDPKESCKDKDLFLVSYIHTAPDHYDRRAMVRRTWANATLYKNAKIKVFFMMGRPGTPELQKALEMEAKEHKDIIQESFVDAYHNLSIKAVGAMRWVTSRCKQAKFILKTDDDVFMNLFGLLPHLRDLDKYHVNNTGLLMCLVWQKMHVLREGKWKIPESVIPDEYYPHYCSGMAYIMSPDVASAIVKASAHVPFFWVDDVYITGMIPKAMGLRHVDIGRLVFGRYEVEWLMSGADWYKYLFSHLRDMNLYMNVWKTLQTRGLNETIPKMPEVVAGKLGVKYGPKKAPDWFKKELEAKKRRQNTRVKPKKKT